MHDPVPQTGEWLKSVVQGYFNYYAVPGNLDSLGVFRERVLRAMAASLRRRSQRHRSTWGRLHVCRTVASSTRVCSILIPSSLCRQSSEIGAVCASERSYGSAIGATSDGRPYRDCRPVERIF